MKRQGSGRVLTFAVTGALLGGVGGCSHRPPGGKYVSFVRDRALHAIEIASGEEIALSPAAEALVSYGMAEFVAQEEMDRHTGYWWAPDDSAVAYAQVDEAPVAIEQIGRAHV